MFQIDWATYKPDINWRAFDPRTWDPGVFAAKNWQFRIYHDTRYADGTYLRDDIRNYIASGLVLVLAVSLIIAVIFAILGAPVVWILVVGIVLNVLCRLVIEDRESDASFKF